MIVHGAGGVSAIRNWLGAGAEAGDALWLLDRAELPAARSATIGGEHHLPEAIRLRLRSQWPLDCRGLQRIEFDEARRVLSFAIGLSARDERGLTQAHLARLHARQDDPAAPMTGPKQPAARALVIGAGIAGLSLAEALARRGWRSTLVDRAGVAGGVVADVPLLAEHPSATGTDDIRTRLLRASMLINRRLDGPRVGGNAEASDPPARHGGGVATIAAAMASAGSRAESVIRCGRRLLADRAAAARALAHWPPELLRQSADDDIRFVETRLLDTRRWIESLLARPEITLKTGVEVASIHHQAGRWAACDSSGNTIAEAPIIFLACQRDALRLGGLLEASPQAIGRMRMAPASVAVGIGASASAEHCDEHASIVGGERYRFELRDVVCVIGPCGDPVGLETIAQNEPAYRWRLSAPGSRMSFDDSLPMFGRVPDVAAALRQRERHARNDRLAWPMRPDLYLLCGLGGRGVLWSRLGAESLVAMAANEAPLLEPSLANATDPVRFLRRSIRRATR